MAKYEIEIIDRHLFADLDGHRALIDTGSPASFGRGSVSWAGEEIELPPAAWAGDIDGLNAIAGLEFDMLIGGDLLGAMPFEIDTTDKRLLVGEERTVGSSEAIDFVLLGNVPIAKGELNGEQVQFALDTGAAVSFAARDLLWSSPLAGEHEDFYPGFGRFTTELFSAQASLGSLSRELTFAALPEGLGLVLTAFGLNGIIGNDLLLSGRSRFDYAAGRMVLETDCRA